MTFTYFDMHLKEWKFYLILNFVLFNFLFLCIYIFINQIIYFLIYPLIELTNINYLICTELSEILQIKILISIIFALSITIFGFIIQIWVFLIPGLYKSENIQIFEYIIIISCIKILLIKFCYFKIIPLIWKFFYINSEMTNKFLFNIFLEPKINNYLDLLLTISLYVLLIFYYFLILFFLIKLKLISIKILLKFWKYFYLKIFICIILITPFDLINQFFISLFLIQIFEILNYNYLLLKNYWNYFWKFLKKE